MSTLRIKNINGTWDKIPILGSAAAVVEAKAQADRAKSEADRAASEAGKFVAGTYYTKTETNSLLSGKADSSTTYTKTETNNLLSNKANSSDLNSKADKSSTYTKSEIDTSLAGYLPLSGGTLSGKVAIKTDLVERGVPPTVYNNIPLFEMRDKNNKMLVSMGFETTAAGDYRFMLNCYKPNESSGYTNDTISICCDKNGSFYAKAPTPSNTDNSTKIATTAFVNGGNVVAQGDNYIRYANGLQLCWGIAGDSPSGVYYKDITLPAPYITHDYSIFCENAGNHQGTGLGNTTISYSTRSRDLTSFRVQQNNHNWGFHWFTIGRWK